MTSSSPAEPPEGTCATFQIADEGHTLGNSLRFMLNKNPHVHVAGYDRPHPSDTFVNVRVQTTGEVSAVEALRTASTNVQEVCTTVASKFSDALATYQAAQGVKGGASADTSQAMESDSD